jgi:hypothetical protein
MTAKADALEAAVYRLVDEYRDRCLWFLREDYYPDTDAGRLRVLAYIQRHGDRAAFRKAASLRQWLSRRSSERSGPLSFLPRRQWTTRLRRPA